MSYHLIGFIAVATLLTITPGADMALVTRNVLRGGMRAGVATSAGILNGLVVWAMLSVAGVAAVLAASATAFTILKLLGAAYLIYLGIVSLWRTGGRTSAAAGIDEIVAPAPFREHYRQGLLSNLLNAKVGIFYTTFLPQFVEPGQPVFAYTSLLAAIHIVIGIGWLGFYAWFVSRVKDAITRPRIRRALDAITGTVLVGFGLRVARDART